MALTVIILFLFYIFFSSRRVFLPTAQTGCRWQSKSRYRDDILQASRTYNMSPEVIEAILWVESTDGVNIQHALDEVGIMAIRPATESQIKLAHPELRHMNSAVPAQAILLGAALLRDNWLKLRNIDKAIIAYNAGVDSIRVQTFDYKTDWYLQLVQKRMQVLCV